MNDSVADFGLSVIVEGEQIDLCAPDESFARYSDWHEWMNDPEVTRYLERGGDRNTPEDQVSFFNDAVKTRRLLVISDRERYVGVASLSAFHLGRQEADLSVIVHPGKARLRGSLFALEACAHMVDRAFEVEGLKKVKSGHHVGLAKWAQRKELLGFRLEGICRQGFRKGSETADALTSSLIREDWEAIRMQRGNRTWDGVAPMRDRIRRLPKSPFSERLADFVRNEGDRYYAEVFSL